MRRLSNWFRGGLPGLASFAAFFLTLYLSTWVLQKASMALFPLDGAAVPDAFFLMHQTSAAKYDVVSWKAYSANREGIGTLRLPAAEGQIRPKATFSFRVLEDDGKRQLVEVEFSGPYHSWSRYEAYADRAVPVAYYSSGEGEVRGAQLAQLGAIVMLGFLAAWGAHAGVKRLVGP